MGAVHQLLLELGREEVLKSDHDRRVVEAASRYLSSEDNEIGFLYSGWAQAALPHRHLSTGGSCGWCSAPSPSTRTCQRGRQHS